MSELNPRGWVCPNLSDPPASVPGNRDAAQPLNRDMGVARLAAEKRRSL